MIDWIRPIKSQRTQYKPNYIGNVNRDNQNKNNSVSRNMNTAPGTGSEQQYTDTGKSGNQLGNINTESGKYTLNENDPKITDYVKTTDNLQYSNDNNFSYTEDVIISETSTIDTQQAKDISAGNTEHLNSVQDGKIQADEAIPNEDIHLPDADAYDQDTYISSHNEERKIKEEPSPNQDSDKASKSQNNPWFNPINDLLIMYIKNKKRM